MTAPRPDYGPPHGTRPRYRDGCRCDDCRAANAADSRARRRALAEGRPLLVDATAARGHIAELRATGFGFRRIAAATGLNDHHVFNLATGRTRTTRPETVAAILALTPDSTPPGVAVRRPVPALGTHRRLRSLTAAGYSLAAIGRAAGLSAAALGRILNNPDRRTVGAITHERVAHAFDRLDPAGPTPRSPHEAATIRARRERARDALWALPAAWDNPDDPNEIRRRNR